MATDCDAQRRPDKCQSRPWPLTTVSSVGELRELRDMYRRDWPRHRAGFYALDNFLRWRQREPGLNDLSIYTMGGEGKVRGLFLIVDRYQLFVDALCPDGDGEGNDLMSSVLSLLDWSRGYKVSSLLERHRPSVMRVVDELRLQPEYDSRTLVYAMSAKEAARLPVDCPPGYVVRPLSEADADTIDALWPNHHRGSLFLLRRLIAWNINAGVYVDGSNELVAWCLRLQGGYLGALQVKESHKRKGFGSLVTSAIARRLATELGHDTMAAVNPDNQPSRGMFSKLGFQVVDTVYWMYTLPKEEGYKWPIGK